MHEDIGDPRVRSLDCVLYFMRDAMAVAHGDSTIYANMEINVEGKSHFPDETFFNFKNSRNRARCFFDNGNDFAARRGVHYLVQRRKKEAITVGADDRAREKRGNDDTADNIV